MLRQNDPRLQVITGCMFSGKTEKLLFLLDRYYWANVKVKLLRPQTDVRGDKTHLGRDFEGIFVPKNINLENLENIIGKKELKETQVIGIDESNFFDNSLIELTQRLVDERGKIIIVAGLDKTFANKGYEPMPQLIHNADEVIYLNAVCSVCGSNYASFTQRLIDGKPATLDSPRDIVGGKKGEKSSQKGVGYEARCRRCYIPPS